MFARPKTVFLVSRDWQSRALLRAQLIEEGLRVKAYLSASEAAESVGSKARGAALVVADVSAPAARDEIDTLSALARRVPVWVIASRTSAGEAALRAQGFEAIVFRPVTLGELAARVKQRLLR
ncbi:MAG: hypothetical protein ACRD3D_07140 [Terriglobia bacterium]